LRSFAALLFWCVAGVARGEGSAKVITLEQAEMAISVSRGIPFEVTQWEPVVLPHAWYRHPPQGGRVVWYRMTFELAEKPRGTHALYARRVGGHSFDFHLNEALLTPQADIGPPGTTVTPLLMPVRPDRLRTGTNVVHVRVVASPEWLQGMPRLHFGPIRDVRAWANTWRLLQVDVIVIFAFGFGMIGLLSLFLWLADRDQALLWYGAIGTAFGLVTFAWHLALPAGDWAVTRPLIYLRFFGFFIPISILQLRLSGRRWYWLEAVLWLALAAVCAFMSASNPSQAMVWNLSMLVLPALLLVSSLALLWPRVPVPTLTRNLLLLAGIAATLIGVHDMLMRTGYLDFDRPWLYYYLIPVFMVTAGAAMFERLIAGVRRLREANVELESRVAAKSREIALAHERNAAAERERALTGERRRIMADMHDVLGSRLVGLLSLVQSGKAPREQLEQELAASLDELRMTIDSVQPVEGDLGVVLGNVRHRMRSVFGATGVTLDWQVGDLPAMEALTPARVLAIQRLLLEVFTNVLKHSAAKTVRVSTALADHSAQIVIEDDGRGFEAGRCSGGHGIDNLSTRAAEAGGTLSISTVPGGGTRVTLTLPLGQAELPRKG
jgi:signal transduction histidine kinase